MARLEDLTSGAIVRGVLAERPVKVIDLMWHGSNAVTLTYRDDFGTVDQRLLYRDHEPSLFVVSAARAYAFDGDPALFRLVAEGLRMGPATAGHRPTPGGPRRATPALSGTSAGVPRAGRPASHRPCRCGRRSCRPVAAAEKSSGSGPTYAARRTARGRGASRTAVARRPGRTPPRRTRARPPLRPRARRCCGSARAAAPRSPRLRSPAPAAGRPGRTWHRRCAGR